MQINKFIPNEKINIFIFIVFLCLCLFLLKWLPSFFIYKNEDLILKTINDSVSDGYYYFPLVKFLAELNLNPSFDPKIDNLKYIPLPLGGLIFHSLIFKITNNFFITIFFIEFFSLLIFISIFFLLFKKFLKIEISLVLALIIYIIPSIIKLLNIEFLPYVNLLETNLYSSRFPRPLIVNVLYFSIIYLIISHDKEIFFKKDIAIYFSLLSTLLLTAFYYYFFIIFCLCLILIIKNISYFYKYFFRIKFFYFLPSIIILLPFFFILYHHEQDFMIRMGSIELNLENKKKLLISFYKQFSHIGFILILIINSSIYMLLKKQNNKVLEIFFYLIFASILAPILFIILSPKINIYYHFNNIIIIQNFLFLIISIIIILKSQLNKISNLNNFIIIIFFIFLFKGFEEYKKNSTINEKRLNTINLINYIKKNHYNDRKDEILTFEPNVMVWLILNNYKNIKILNGNFISKTDEMIEEDLSNALSILNFDDADFENFVSNKKQSWRYINFNIQKLFFLKYTANSFSTFENSNDFTLDEKKIIRNSSAFLTQQSIIPKFELERLKEKFSNKSKKTEDLVFPKILIFDKNLLQKKHQENKFNYCLSYQNTNYQLFVFKDEQNC